MPASLAPLTLPTPRQALPPITVVGPGVEVVLVGDVIRIDVSADDGSGRITRFVTIEDARQLVTALARLSR